MTPGDSYGPSIQKLLLPSVVIDVWSNLLLLLSHTDNYLSFGPDASALPPVILKTLAQTFVDSDL